MDRPQLVAEIARLQQELVKLDAAAAPSPPLASTSTAPPPPPPPPPAPLAPTTTRRARKKAPLGPLPPSLAAAPKRHVALLFSYEGWAYSGLAYQPVSSPTPLPTVEGTILAALEQARLIEPMIESDGFGCGFERCGRTDAGVSSSAQVINLWLRSDLDDPMKTQGAPVADELPGGRFPRRRRDSTSSTGSADSASDVRLNGARRPPALVELPYVALLNRLLPPTVRILAWSPVSATFSSRYSCIWRHYKYFFSASPKNPFLRPSFDYGAAYRKPTLDSTSSSSADAGDDRQLQEWQRRIAAIDWKGMELDVGLMREAVAKLVGEHDYRNLCKVDPPKQLTSHQRTVVSATIDEVEGEGDDMFVLNLRGSAFLYNQVRHIVALLFLVGARLEKPNVIEKLLWTSDRTETTLRMHPLRDGEEREVMDRKPGYEMADDLPLILWQCGFNSTELDWRIDNCPLPHDDIPLPTPETLIDPNGRLGKLALDPIETFRRQFLEMNETWTQHRLRALVLKHHLASYSFHAPTPATTPIQPPPDNMTFTPNGAGRSSKTASYTPLLDRKRAELPEELNRRWAEGRGQLRMLRREENQERADALREVNLAKKAAARLEEARLRSLEA